MLKTSGDILNVTLNSLIPLKIDMVASIECEIGRNDIKTKKINKRDNDKYFNYYRRKPNIACVIQIKVCNAVNPF